ncbi:class I SAM-dependent methyltransferase [Candidatus Bathyarchaeota archaeon A05DMB-2]|nr:class I SAM-dependent methyltransferase [Candidatus Bathyarchaeota archaeon A05DMB-2]
MCNEDKRVADIWAGGSYFALRFAEIVGTDGRVFAVDTNQNFLDFVKEKAKEKGLVNVETVLAAKNDVALPEKA